MMPPQVPCALCGKPGTPQRGAYDHPATSICPDCRKVVEDTTGCTLSPTPTFPHRVVASCVGIVTDFTVEAADIHDVMKQACPFPWIACVQNHEMTLGLRQRRL